MKVSLDPGSSSQDPNENNKHIENFNTSIGTAKALDPVSVKAFENTAGKKSVVLYDPHKNPALGSPEATLEEKTTYIPIHLLDREYDPERKSLIQHLRSKAIEHAIASSDVIGEGSSGSNVAKVASPEGLPQATLEPGLDEGIKNQLRQTTQALLQNQMKLIESNPNVKKSVLSQLANMGVIPGHTPSSISKISNPSDINLLYSRVVPGTTSGGASGNSLAGPMKKMVMQIAANQLGDRIRSYPGTNLELLLKNRRDTDDNTGMLEKLAQTLNFLSQLSSTSPKNSASQSSKGKANQGAVKPNISK